MSSGRIAPHGSARRPLPSCPRCPGRRLLSCCVRSGSPSTCWCSGRSPLMIWLGVLAARSSRRNARRSTTTVDRADRPAAGSVRRTARRGRQTIPKSIEWRQVDRHRRSTCPIRSPGSTGRRTAFAGDNVLTALIDGDTTVVVNRGFVPLGDDVRPPPTRRDRGARPGPGTPGPPARRIDRRERAGAASPRSAGSISNVSSTSFPASWPRCTST